MAKTMDSACSNLLLTGRPGVGKTTVIRRIAERLTVLRLAGFYTEEIRVGGRRQGFRVETFSGSSGTLAHSGCRTSTRVGRYGVDVTAFERLVLPEFARPCDVMLIDEIGKMECFSARFIETVRDLLYGPVPVLATIAVSGGGFIAEVKRRPDVELWKVTETNRDQLPDQLFERLSVS